MAYSVYDLVAGVHAVGARVEVIVGVLQANVHFCHPRLLRSHGNVLEVK